MPQATGTIQFRRGSYNAVGVGGKVLAEGEPAILVDHRIIIGQDRGGSLSTLAEALADNRAFAYHNGEAHQFGGATNRVQLEVKSHPTQTPTTHTFQVTDKTTGIPNDFTQHAIRIHPDTGHTTIHDCTLRATDTAMRVRSGAPSSTTMKAFEIQRGDTTVFSVSNSGCVTVSPTDEAGANSPSVVVNGSGHASQTNAFTILQHDNDLMMKVTNTQNASPNTKIVCKELIIAGQDPNDPNDDSSELNASAALPRTHSLKSGIGPSHTGASVPGQSFNSFPYYSMRTEQPDAPLYNAGQQGDPTFCQGHLMLLTAPTNNDNNKPLIFRKVNGPSIGAGDGAMFVVQFGTSSHSPRVFCGPVNVQTNRFGPPMVHPNGQGAGIADAASGRLIVADKSTVVRSLVTNSSLTPYSVNDNGALNARVLAREEVVKAFELIFTNTGEAEEDDSVPNPGGQGAGRFFVFRIRFDVFTILDQGAGKPHITGVNTIVSKNLPGGSAVGSGSGQDTGAGFFVRTR